MLPKPCGSFSCAQAAPPSGSGGRSAHRGRNEQRPPPGSGAAPQPDLTWGQIGSDTKISHERLAHSTLQNAGPDESEYRDTVIAPLVPTPTGGSDPHRSPSLNFRAAF